MTEADLNTQATWGGIAILPSDDRIIYEPAPNLDVPPASQPTIFGCDCDCAPGHCPCPGGSGGSGGGSGSADFTSVTFWQSANLN